jgi:predicted metal-binding membrane protein
MRFRLRTLLIVAGVAPLIVWATTLWLAAWMESAGARGYKSSGRGSFASEAAQDSKAANLPSD